MATMKAAIFVEKNRIVLDDKPIPEVGPLDALVRITTTTICGTDVHILRGEYPVAQGLTVGHEPVGFIERLGSQVRGFVEGQRVIAGAITPNFREGDVVEQIMALTDGRGVDVAIEALGTQGTFESALRVLRPGGRLSSLGVYSSDLRIPLDAFAAGLGDYSIVTTLCPGGKERMRRLMAVVQSGMVDLSPLVTHRFKLDDIEAAYDLFAHQRDGVMKVAITP